jgi:hypothetical protein
MTQEAFDAATARPMPFGAQGHVNPGRAISPVMCHMDPSDFARLKLELMNWLQACVDEEVESERIPPHRACRNSLLWDRPSLCGIYTRLSRIPTVSTWAGLFAKI